MKKAPPRYKGEQALKDELRQLTEQTRKLREELTDMVSAPKQDLTRALLHTQSWSKERRREQPPAADDRRRKKR